MRISDWSSDVCSSDLAYAVVIAALISFIAKFLVLFINIITNLSFYGTFSFHEGSPWGANLGIWVIVVTAIGGLIVGLMALYGSKAIRGHGIPEAMEQLLTNQSKTNTGRASGRDRICQDVLIRVATE